MSWWNTNIIIGTNGDDTIMGSDGKDIVISGGGDDVITTGGGNDIILSGRGDDTIDAGDGNDYVHAGSGNDTVYGGNGCDYIVAGSGNDVVYGGDHNDLIFGNSGNDILVGGSGNDKVFGGHGDDTAVYVVGDNIGSWDYYNGGSGFDTLLIQVDNASAMTLGYVDAADFAAQVEAFFDANNGNHRVNFWQKGFDLYAKRFENIEIEIIGNVNNDPDAVDDTSALNENSVLIVNAAFGLLSNDTDIDGDSLMVDAINGVQSDVGMQITLSSGALLTVNSDGSYHYNTNGQFDYIAAGETDTDTFSYTITDGQGGFDTAEVTVTIQGENDAPNAVDDVNAVDEDSMVMGNVLANDDDVDTSDVANLQVTSPLGTMVLSSGATLTMNSDGNYTYDASTSLMLQALETGEVFVDTFIYQMSDGNGGVDSATVDITVTGAGGVALVTAYSDLNNNDVFDAGDTLIAKIVDENNNNVIDAGDLLVLGSYPDDFTPTSSTPFAASVLEIHGPVLSSDISVTISAGDAGYEYRFINDGGSGDLFRETLSGSTVFEIEDTFGVTEDEIRIIDSDMSQIVADGTPNGVQQMANGFGDQNFLDVDIFI